MCSSLAGKKLALLLCVTPVACEVKWSVCVADVAVNERRGGARIVIEIPPIPPRNIARGGHIPPMVYDEERQASLSLLSHSIP